MLTVIATMRLQRSKITVKNRLTESIADYKYLLYYTNEILC